MLLEHEKRVYGRMATREQNQFQQFFMRNFPKVKNFALMLLKSEEEAEDVAQDIFCRLWLKPEIWLDNSDNLDHYLYVLTKNSVLNIFKRQQTNDCFKSYIKNTSVYSELIGDDILDDIYYEEKALLVEMALERLPAKRREIFIMSRFDEMSNKEIAEKLGLSVRTIEHQIYLSLSELKKIILLLLPILFTQIPQELIH